jgi:hypothetical protein
VEIFRLWYFVFEISIKLPDSGFKGLMGTDGAFHFQVVGIGKWELWGELRG